MATTFIHENVKFPGSIPWHSLSSELSDKLKQGSLRLTRENTVEPIYEDGERLPLINGKKTNGHSRHEESSASAEPRVGVSWPVGAFLLVNAALGTGILNYPNAYNKAGGVLMATILQMLMLVLLLTTMVILAYCSDLNKDNTYHDVLLSMCGRKAQQLSAMTITTTCFGISVAVLIIIGDQFDRLLASMWNQQFCTTWYLDRYITITITGCCFILPLCYFKRLDFLKYAGSLGIFAMLYPVMLTVYVYYAKDINPGRIKSRPDTIVDAFAVIPVICLAYQCHEVVVPVYSCLRDRNLPNFVKSSFLAMGFLMLLYCTIGSFGYLSFGADVVSDIMTMYNANDPVVAIGVGALIIKMIVTYPALALCGRGAVDGLYAEFTGMSANNFIKGEFKRRVVIATVWFIISLVLALFTPNVGVVIELLGCVACINIFVFPGVCLLSATTKHERKLSNIRRKFLTALACFIIAFGAFCFGTVLVKVIIEDIIKGRREHVQLCS